MANHKYFVQEKNIVEFLNLFCFPLSGNIPRSLETHSQHTSFSSILSQQPDTYLKREHGDKNT